MTGGSQSTTPTAAAMAIVRHHRRRIAHTAASGAEAADEHAVARRATARRSSRRRPPRRSAGRVVAHDRPHEQHEGEERHDAQPQVPRLAEDLGAVRPDEHEQGAGARCRRQRPAAPSPGDDEDGGDGGGDDERRRRLERPARLAEQPVGGQQREPRRRPGVRPLLGDRADAPAQPGQRRVGEEPPHVELRLRHVAGGVPVVVGQGDDGDDERHEHERDERPDPHRTGGTS